MGKCPTLLTVLKPPHVQHADLNCGLFGVVPLSSSRLISAPASIVLLIVCFLSERLFPCVSDGESRAGDESV